MDDGQKTPPGHPDFYSYVKILRVFIFRTDRITDGETNTLAAHGLEELLFFQLCCSVSFWFWWEIGFGYIYYVLNYVLRVQYSCGVVSVFWFWWEIVFGVMYVLSIQNSCAVVSVFWLWWEIVLKMRTRFYKKILLGYFL
jgi:hypothetical protein